MGWPVAKKVDSPKPPNSLIARPPLHPTTHNLQSTMSSPVPTPFDIATNQFTVILAMLGDEESLASTYKEVWLLDPEDPKTPAKIRRFMSRFQDVITDKKPWSFIDSYVKDHLKLPDLLPALREVQESMAGQEHLYREVFEGISEGLC